MISKHSVLGTFYFGSCLVFCLSKSELWFCPDKLFLTSALLCFLTSLMALPMGCKNSTDTWILVYQNLVDSNFIWSHLCCFVFPCFLHFKIIFPFQDFYIFIPGTLNTHSFSSHLFNVLSPSLVQFQQFIKLLKPIQYWSASIQQGIQTHT